MRVRSLAEGLVHIKEYFAQRGEQHIRAATPLGLGKPNQLVNLVYDWIKSEPRMKLTLYTALSLDPPEIKDGLEGRFLGPFVDRFFGSQYPRLHYVQDRKSQSLPAHIRVEEFYLEAAAFLGNGPAQRDYVSLNYTHVSRSLIEHGVELILVMVAQREGRLSLSSNTDLTLDVAEGLAGRGRPSFKVAVIHPDLPFMGGEAEVAEDFFDLVIESPEVKHKLFAVPRGAVDTVDSMIGFHASRLVEDGGTLQIGIGSLSDAIVQALLIRQQQNGVYRQLAERFAPSPAESDRAPLAEGLYGVSELVMDGFMQLRKAGLLRRTVREKGKSVYVHGAFFLGSPEFYQWLRSLEGEDAEGFAMTRVSVVNDLYDSNEDALRFQRKKARFFNTCLQVTGLGAAASDTLDDGQVLSGIGGQYNFVAMAQELEGARSILMLRSTRKGSESNIIWKHGNIAIPRHLRDIVVTEYGIADLRGKTDEEVVQALIGVMDAAHQDAFVDEAKAAFKLAPNYEVPASARANTPEQLRKKLGAHASLFPTFPFGSDFTGVELQILGALKALKKAGPKEWAEILWASRKADAKKYRDALSRLELWKATDLKTQALRQAVLGSLQREKESRS